MSDFNGMSTRLGLFYAETLGNHIHIYISCAVVSKGVFCFHTVPSNMNNFKKIYLINRWNPNSTNTVGQGGSGSNDNKGVLHITQTSRIV